MSDLTDTSRFCREVGEWHRAWFPIVQPEEILCKLAEEVGELCGAYQKGKTSTRLSRRWEEREGDAIGDIAIVLAAYCERRGFDLDAEIVHAWDEVRNRSRDRVTHNCAAEDADACLD